MGQIVFPIFLKLAQDINIDNISVKFDHGWGGVKSRSQGQILEKSCLQSRCHIFGPIFPKLDQNICFDDISVKIDHELGWVKE